MVLKTSKVLVAAMVSLLVASNASAIDLPLMAEEARARGYDLPLPFGVSLLVIRLDGRKIDVTDVRIGVEGSPTSVSDFVDLGSTSDVFNANIKLDAWLLPFLNLYALLGYVHNTSTTHARVDLDPPGPLPAVESENEIETELDGLIGGGGATLAGGWRDFYLVVDVNYVQTDLGFDDDFNALISTIRSGWNGKIEDTPVQVWLGLGSWDTAATAKGHVDLENGDTLVFEADQEPKSVWMYDVGANIAFSKRFQLVVDVGFDFDGGYLIVLGPTYRFDL